MKTGISVPEFKTAPISIGAVLACMVPFWLAGTKTAPMGAALAPFGKNRIARRHYCCFVSDLNETR